MRKIGKYLSLLFAPVLVLSLLLAGCGGKKAGETSQQANSQQETEQAETVESATDGNGEQKPADGVDSADNGSSSTEEIPKSELTVHFIDVGQGDATLITCGDSHMLIDGGDETSGTALQLYLKKQEIKKLDAVIATHPDADHIGGLDVIATKVSVGTFYMPDVVNDTRAFQEMVEAIRYRRIPADVLTGESPYRTFALGDAAVELWVPSEGAMPSEDAQNNNNHSIVVRVTYGNGTFLFMGDAEHAEEQALLESGFDVRADVLKVAHHGSSDSTGKRFLQEVDPEAAVISCGMDNGYGHPHEGLLHRLKERNVALFRTDEQGTIVLSCDGGVLYSSCEPSETWKSGSFAEITRGGMPEETATYVLNTGSGKFHRPGCSAVLSMSAKNRKSVSLTREEVVAQGYEPCGYCKP